MAKMANRWILLCLFYILLATTVESKSFGRSSGRSRSSGSHTSGGYSHTSGGYSHSTSYSSPWSHSYPSSSSGFSGYGFSAPSHGSTGFSSISQSKPSSGYNSSPFGSTAGSSSFYPKSKSGLSGNSKKPSSGGIINPPKTVNKQRPGSSRSENKQVHVYPSSNTGLSGSQNKSPLSGSTKLSRQTVTSVNKLSGSSVLENKQSPNYASSNSGLSGNSNKPSPGGRVNPPTIVNKPWPGSSGTENKQVHVYPSSNFGLSGSHNKSSLSGSTGLSRPTVTSVDKLSGPSVLENKQSPNYASSNSGLSGNGNKSLPATFRPNPPVSLIGKPSANYPLSNSGLSGSHPTLLPVNKTNGPTGLENKPSPSYPSSNSGLSGSHNKSLLESTGNSYPSGPSRLSGSENKSYPASNYSLFKSGQSDNNKPLMSTISGTPFGTGQPSKPSAPISLPITPSTSGTSVSYPPIGPVRLPVTPSTASGHSYPKQPSGLSGSGHHLNASLSGTNSSLVSHNINIPPRVNLSHSGIPAPTATLGGSAHSYPSTPTGLSGSGGITTAGHYPTNISGTGHSYPTSSTGLSGAGSKNLHPQFVPPQNSYGSVSKIPHHYDNKYPSSYGNSQNLPSYYSSPQYVYITEYRNSGSRYSDLLTGLALYNVGRSNSHHHVNYYYDDYYVRRYESNSNYNTENRQKAVTLCMLKIKENNNVQSLKIPCEIVSTFTDGAVKRNVTTNTVCVTNTTTVLNNTVAGNSTKAGANITTVNATTCTTNTVDPLSVKGPKINSSNMECSVEIKTSDSFFHNNVDCNVLINYSKMPEPKKVETSMMPSRAKLKSWLEKPPWWMSLVIAA